MTFQEKIGSLARDIKNQCERLELFQELDVIFEGIKLPADMYVYASKLYDGQLYVEFSPSSELKDVRPFVHSMARKFHCKFKKEKSFNGASLVYQAEFEFNGHSFDLKVSGVIPATCHVEEKEVPLTPEEIEEARANVPTTRKERKIVCGK